VRCLRRPDRPESLRLPSKRLKLAARQPVLSSISTMTDRSGMSFEETVQGLMAGDFSRLAPLFQTPPDGLPCPIITWFDEGLFAGESEALKEAFTCACLNGFTDVIKHFLARAVDPSGGNNTGLNAFHWAAKGDSRNAERVRRNGLGLCRLVSRSRAKARSRSDC